jgi:hypothetical protein
MNSETRTRIARMVYHLGNENRASADKELKEIVKFKIKSAFETEYEKVKTAFSKEKQ